MNHSYIITDKKGVAVFETWDKKVADKVNTDEYIVQTAHDYLCALNEKIRLSN
jgi:hypothetical protein